MPGRKSEYDYFKDRIDRNLPREERKLIRVKQGVERYGVCRETVRNWAKECGAYQKVKGVVFIDCEIMDNFIESFRVPGRVY